MAIRRAQAGGFCFGVQRAVELALSTLKQASPATPVYSVGPLIHNPQVVEELVRQGLRIVEAVDEVEAGYLLVRSHGLIPSELAAARARGVEIVDATCPFVVRVQELVVRLEEEGYHPVIIGEGGHPEVKAVAGAAKGPVTVINSPEEVENLVLPPRVGVVSQTTQNQERVSRIVGALAGRVQELRVFRTLCHAAQERQQETAALARQCQVMVVVGGRNSANTRQLVEICRAAGVPTYHVESAQELQAAWFEDVEEIGLTAGASTPSWTIEEVVKRMEEIKSDQERPQNTQPAEQAAELETTPFAAPVVELTPGKTVTARVVQIQPDQVLVDIGYKTEGVIQKRELSNLPVGAIEDVVSVGDEFPAQVLKVDEENDVVILSKRRADAALAWERLKRAKANNETIEAPVREQVKGGLLVDVGVRGFIPSSHVGRGFPRDLSQYVGKTLRLKVLELEENRRNVVLSNKLAEEDDRARAREEVMATLKKGMIVEGEVKRLTDFGAFVDIGRGVEGLLHVSELAWHRVEHPRQVLSEGEKVRVMVLKVEPETGRISLGLKQTLPDPWDDVAEEFKPGQVVPGEITRVVDFGAFVKLKEGVEGLVHISQLADHRVEKAEDAVKVGDQVQVKILSVDPEAKRISLSIRQALPKKEKEKAKERKERGMKAEPEEDRVTLGDVFGELFEQKS
ncbi:MAG: bifunctional 4-hydroxy-3-methylbut-2-enyl diphosphate reductase/30S ribosomal protein S1 [Bacillota bacterium]|nr:bifunctional 4-hydroxy-3-methylbut-2-enyl diphosphate reductase/30S ribosomal protein S1 [Bacillota bacterium]